MVLTLLAWVSLGIVAIRLMVVLSNGWFKYHILKSACAVALNPEISVLIPARNEAHNLSNLLESLRDTAHLVNEIIVYNDQSEDDTAEVVKRFRSLDSRVKLVEGETLPPGWLGKNYACHQLAGRASGRYFLYLDADVTVEKEAIETALKIAKQRYLALFSFFPVQVMKSMGEWLVVPHVNIVLVSMLPLWVMYQLPFSIFAAANGQFMLFDAVVYRQYWFHRRLKFTAVEDIAISRLMKKLKLEVLTVTAPQSVRCRMYRGFSEAINGIARSVLFFFGGSLFLAWLYLLFTTLGVIFVWKALSLLWLVVYLTLLIVMRLFAAVISRQGAIKNVVLMPLQQGAFVGVILMATIRFFKGNISLKGRTIKAR